MPKDEWKRANNRATYGATRYTKKKKAKPKITSYPAGTKDFPIPPMHLQANGSYLGEVREYHVSRWNKGSEQ